MTCILSKSTHALVQLLTLKRHVAEEFALFSLRSSSVQWDEGGETGFKEILKLKLWLYNQSAMKFSKFLHFFVFVSLPRKLG